MVGGRLGTPADASALLPHQRSTAALASQRTSQRIVCSSNIPPVAQQVFHGQVWLYFDEEGAGTISGTKSSPLECVLRTWPVLRVRALAMGSPAGHLCAGTLCTCASLHASDAHAVPHGGKNSQVCVRMFCSRADPRLLLAEHHCSGTAVSWGDGPAPLWTTWSDTSWHGLCSM